MSKSGIDVGSVEEFDEGRPHAVRAGERDLVIVRRGDDFYAVRDACPHQGAKLSSGYLTGDVEPCKVGDQPHLARDGEFLACPWHGWKVDIRTGRSPVQPETIRVRNYEVQVDQGRVYVHVESR